MSIVNETREGTSEINNSVRYFAEGISREFQENVKDVIAKELGFNVSAANYLITGNQFVSFIEASQKAQKLSFRRNELALPAIEARKIETFLKKISFGVLVEILREDVVWSSRESPVATDSYENIKQLFGSGDYFSEPSEFFNTERVSEIMNYLTMFVKDPQRYTEWKRIAADLSIALTLLGSSDWKQKFRNDSEQHRNILSMLDSNDISEQKSLRAFLTNIGALSPDQACVQITDRLIQRIHVMGPLIFRVSKESSAVLAFLTSSMIIKDSIFEAIKQNGMYALSNEKKRAILTSGRVIAEQITGSTALAKLKPIFYAHTFLGFAQLSDESNESFMVMKFWLDKLMSENKLISGQTVQLFSAYWKNMTGLDIQENEIALFMLNNFSDGRVQGYLKEFILLQLELSNEH